jgi:nucleoside-diphosphate-sugar epimerase
VKVLVLGAGGFLGPHVVAALESEYELCVTDVKPMDSPHQTLVVDAADLDQVRRATNGCGAIVNCSVARQDRCAAFGVNTVGTYNALRAAVDLGHERFINTGPLFTLAGSFYRDFDFDIRESVPAHSGTGLYALSKAAGQEICRIFAQNHSIHVLTMIFSSFKDAQPASADDSLGPLAITFRDAAQAVKKALTVDLARLPSRCEAFFVTADLPHGRYSNAKAKRLLGFAPQDGLEGYWKK